MCATVCICMYVPVPACACLYVCQSVCSAVGVRLLVCLTLAMACCRRGPAEARWGLWSVTQSPQPWIKLMLQIPSLQLSCAPSGRTTFEQRDLVPARGWCLFNMSFECSDWLIPLTGSRREDERESQAALLVVMWNKMEASWKEQNNRRKKEKCAEMSGGVILISRWQKVFH